MTIKSEFGNWAEDRVAQYLITKGYEVIENNYRKSWGEIDIIAEKEGILVFVEVKASKDDIIGFEPENRVSPEKLRRLMRAIQTYLAAKKYDSDQEWQIDVVALTLDQNRGVAKIKHFKNIDA
ncbi:MAG: YraN family protein [Candidatus Yanofskybacteria bacterium]|nr:YraN family protein [Candidatus Yanofskybacteria bacterium]